MRTPKILLRLLVLTLGLALAGVGCGGGDEEGGQATTGGGQAAQNVITVNWGTEPPSLDPGLATDVTSANILLNLMDPLVRLGPDLEPVPALARSWDVDGDVVTFHLRPESRWTNGERVTAHDFVYSWKRTLSPQLAADYAYQFYGIVGAQAYNTCKSGCAALRAKVGARALD